MTFEHWFAIAFTVVNLSALYFGARYSRGQLRKATEEYREAKEIHEEVQRKIAALRFT